MWCYSVRRSTKMPIRLSLMPKKLYGTRDWNSYVRYQLVVSVGFSFQIVVFRLSLLSPLKSLEFSHRCVCILHIARHKKGSPVVTRNWRKKVLLRTSICLISRCVQVLWTLKNNQERLSQRVDMNVQQWIKLVILATHKMDIEFLVIVSAQFLSYPQENLSFRQFFCF